MKNGTFHPAIGLIVVFIFSWSVRHVEAPEFPALGIAWNVKAAGEYFLKAGEDIHKAEKEIERVGMRIAGYVREVTAYNVGVKAQTSDTPCIGASGRDLCELVERNVKVCAANFVPLGTILKIDAYGECIVLDRMHSRFSHRVDIAMKEDEIEEARKFGIQKRVVEALF